MKKNYIIPSVKVAQVKAPRILAGSGPSEVDPTATPVQGGDAKKGNIGFIEFMGDEN